MRINRRTVFACLLLGLALVLLLFALHAAFETEHDCLGAHCPVCARLAHGAKLRTALPSAAATLCVFLPFLWAKRIDTIPPRRLLCAQTLVSLSVRFSE